MKVAKLWKYRWAIMAAMALILYAFGAEQATAVIMGAIIMQKLEDKT